MYIYICIFTCICICICIWIIHIHMYIQFTYMYVYIHICIFIYIYIYVGAGSRRSLWAGLLLQSLLSDNGPVRGSFFRIGELMTSQVPSSTRSNGRQDPLAQSKSSRGCDARHCEDPPICRRSLATRRLAPVKGRFSIYILVSKPPQVAAPSCTAVSINWGSTSSVSL